MQSLASGATTLLNRIFKKNRLDYPADQKLLAVGGGNFDLAALTSGQVSAAFLVVPLVYAAEEQGLRALVFTNYFPDYQLTVMAVQARLGGTKPQPDGALLKSGAAGKSLAFANKEPAVDFLAKEIQSTPELACKGQDYYISNRIWHPMPSRTWRGMMVAVEILAEQTKVTRPDPLRYIDHGYLQQTIKE